MIGQVAALRRQAIPVEKLHQDVAVESSAWLTGLLESSPAAAARPVKAKPSQIAIVGMTCLMPGATTLQTYWENILDKVDAVTEIPRARWDIV